MKYKVEWEDEIENARGPLDAAMMCSQDIADGNSLVFTVTELKTGKKYLVDLNADGEDQITIKGE